jgi:hypothetical protein
MGSPMTPEQQRQHKAIRKIRGKASFRKCEICLEKQAAEWSWIHGTNRNIVRNYRALCKRCHVQYDHESMSREKPPEVREKVRQALTGIVRSEETRRRLSELWRNGKRDRAEISRKIKEKNTGKKRTPEQIARIRKGRWGY